MFKSPQVASGLLMVSSGHLSWTGNLLSHRQTRIIFLSPHSVIVTSSCALTHVMVTTIPPNGLNLTFPIIAIWPLSPAPLRPPFLSLPLPSGRYPPPQHVARSPVILVAAHHWCLQPPATQWACVWF